jgi:hypothetical protein
VIVFPVRHHSPAGARWLATLIHELRPHLILIEGPSDATPLIPHLLATDTRPPVAILAYLSAEALAEGEEPRSSAWPLCDYSPEYVAMRVGHQVGAELRFFDLPAGAFLEQVEPSRPGHDASPDVWRAIAQRFGFEDYEEFWECRFEMIGDGDLAEAMLELGRLVREFGVDDHDLARESWMRAELARALAEGYDATQILIVCGAAHAPALEMPLPDPPTSQSPNLPISQPTNLPTFQFSNAPFRPAHLTVIPYSYPRLSEQLGYGAGNRAPAYYQVVWQRGGDFGQASQQALIRTGEVLHQAGYAVSLADAIEANRLAHSLALLRDKPAPGLSEVREVAQACYGRGVFDVDRVLWPLLIGEAVGSVSVQVARTALQQEFHDTVARLGLPFSDAPREHRLYLTEAAGVEASVFLHRLVAVEIPFGQVQAVQMVGPGPSTADASDPARWLGQLREKWILQWTPLTDIRLAESSVQGDSLAEVCARRFRHRLSEAQRVADAADVLLHIVLTRLEPLYPDGLAACERTSSADEDLPSLARAAHALYSLVKYGSSRAAHGSQSMALEAIERLLSKVYVRASMLLPAAAAVADEAVHPTRDALLMLHDVARQSSLLDGALLAGRLRLTAQGAGSHPTLSGLSGTLLFMSGDLSEPDLTTLLSQWLSGGAKPLAGAQFLEGLLALNRAVLLRNQAIVGWLDGYLQTVPGERFVAVLPVLRRAFADLAPAEMDYLLGTLARLLGLEPDRAGAAVQPPVTADELAAIDEELDGLLDKL